MRPSSLALLSTLTVALPRAHAGDAAAPAAPASDPAPAPGPGTRPATLGAGDLAAGAAGDAAVGAAVGATPSTASAGGGFARRTTVATNPAGLFAGLYEVSAAHAITPRMALGASVTSYVHGGDGFVVAALSAPIFLRRALSGPFVEPGVAMYVSWQTNWTDPIDPGVMNTRTTSVDDAFAAVGAMVGWQWMSRAGLTVAVAAGAARRFPRADPESHGLFFDTLPAGYVRAGYAF